MKRLYSRVRQLLYIGAIIGVLLSVCATPLSAATSADISVTATPAFISISCNQASYDFGVTNASATVQTDEGWAGITNGSTVSINVAISVTAATWSGGVGWTHSDTATAGADTVGLKSNAGGTWGVSDVIVKYNSPNNIKSSLAASTPFSFGLQMLAPTSMSDGDEKSITVRLTATAS